MAPDDRVQVILEVEPTADPIAGVAIGPDGEPRSFRGWTALADAVACAVTGSDGEGQRA